MKYKALKSFSGLVSMFEGEIKEIENKDIVNDLLNAHYIEEVKETKKTTKRTTKKTPK